MTEISKADWKLYRERVVQWQENYMERLIKNYIKLLSSKEDASERFWKLAERIKRDKRHPGVRIELRKSEAVWDIAMFVKKKVIKLDDLAGFSSELIEEVKAILLSWRIAVYR